MGTYNPHAPVNIGQEWVPIRDESLEFSAFTNEAEYGHTFVLSTARILDMGTFYINDWPSVNAFPGQPANQLFAVSVYPTGTEDLSGPIESVIIPCTGGGVTGTATSYTFTDVGNNLSNPSDASGINVLQNETASISMFFNTNPYIQLKDKRILGVEFLYTLNVPGSDVSGVTSVGLELRTDNSSFQAQSYASLSPLVNAGDLKINTVASISAMSGPVQSTSLGSVTPFWTTSGVFNSSTDKQWMPWTYDTLRRFEANFGSTRLLALMSVTQAATSATLTLGYAALRVYYCTEQRVATTTWRIGASFGLPRMRYVMGANQLPTFRSPVFPHSTLPILGAGTYTVTLSSPNGRNQVFGTSPKVNASRQLYTLPSHVGKKILIPVPLSDHVGEVLEVEDVQVLPQISLHTSGGPLPEVHVYGRQAVAKVYGSITATQEIQDGLAGGSTTWPYVRYYARRFGNTTVPLTLTGASQSVAITPAEFDDLDEIADGWKEVTLSFTTAPTMGTGTQPQFVWSATGENQGNRWEVLGATAPAVSGIPGNLLNLVAPSSQQLSSATYGQPVSGSTINLGWIDQYAPPVTATVDDQTSDAVIIFGTNVPLVTGFAVTTAQQAVSGIGTDCGVNPCCIPSSITYNQLSWALPVNSGYAADAFNRTSGSGWGTADTGQTWTLSGAAGQYTITTGKGIITPTSSGTDTTATLASTGPNFDITATIGNNGGTFASGSLEGMLLGRFTNASNFYQAGWVLTSAGALTVELQKMVAGTPTTIKAVTMTTFSPVVTLGAGSAMRIRFVGYGSWFKVKIWSVVDDEPDNWLIVEIDTSLTTGTSAGVFAFAGTSTGKSVFYQDLLIQPPGYWFGSYELQRMDSLTDWQTIMLATDPWRTSFNDYEARVGLQSDYRIRRLDALGFEGTWSSTVSVTPSSPGVSGGCIDDGHVLIFSSNEYQDGSVNLAYSEAWMGDEVREDFQFPEAGFTQLQPMYGRDFFTAFRPLERGGETFTRNILVQAAAISPETLADFTDLRDMAWASANYICVRDEDGNRWFATIGVPSGVVRLNRSIYMAQIQVVETTDTATPVDP